MHTPTTTSASAVRTLTPGGFAQYVMLEVPTLGFVNETRDALVTGIVDAVLKARRNLQPGTIRTNRCSLGTDSNINRSPTSYVQNPQSERD